MLQPECIWIFDQKAIRKRYKNAFADENLLQEIETDEAMNAKTEKLSLAEWQFLKRMEKGMISVNVVDEDQTDASKDQMHSHPSNQVPGLKNKRNASN